MCKQVTKERTAAQIKAEWEKNQDAFLDALDFQDSARRRVSALACRGAKLTREYREAVSVEAGIAEAKRRVAEIKPRRYNPLVSLANLLKKARS